MGSRRKKAWVIVLTLFCVLSVNLKTSNVFASEQVEQVDVFFDLYGGTFDVSHPDFGILEDTDNFGTLMEVGTTFKKVDISVTNPMFWDTNREFLGWRVCDAGWNELETKLYSTDEVLNYIIPDQTIIFAAQWSGNEADYYSEVIIDGYGGKIPVSVIRGLPEGGIEVVDEEKECCENYLKEDKTPISVQISNDYEIKGDPKKDGAVFEGWLEFSFDYAGKDGAKTYQLVSEKLSKTTEVVERLVPKENVLFVAKWSDLSIQDYCKAFGVAYDNGGADDSDTPDSKVEIENGLQKVPEEIAEKYASVDDMKKEMTKKALSSNSALSADKVKSVFMDVKLLVKNADGKWVPVTYENFPKEGVEVTIPYPEGTNKDAYQFVVAHMITGGEHAGEVEILNPVLTDSGIKVTFTSMSPVSVLYQEKAAGNKPEPKPEPKPEQQPEPKPETKPQSQPQAGGNNGVVVSPKTEDMTPTIPVVTIFVGSMVLLAGIAVRHISQKQ